MISSLPVPWYVNSLQSSFRALLFSDECQGSSGFDKDLRDFFNVASAYPPVVSSQTFDNQLTYGGYCETDKQAVASRIAKIFLCREARRRLKLGTSDTTDDIGQNNIHNCTQ